MENRFRFEIKYQAHVLYLIRESVVNTCFERISTKKLVKLLATKLICKKYHKKNTIIS
jgi:hypothetical protein